jgi:DNA-binding Lrp family transcriptional regulator
MKELGKKDLLLVSCLRNNARENLTKLSRKTSIPVSTIYDKLNTYKDTIITKHTTLLDFTKLGFHARANILIKVERDSKEALKEYLASHQNVNSLYRVSNGYDFLIEGIFKHVKQVEDFLEGIDKKFSMEQSQVFYVVEDVKKEIFMNNQNMIDLLM